MLERGAAPQYCEYLFSLQTFCCCWPGGAVKYFYLFYRKAFKEMLANSTLVVK
jgi:hypothetical protein